MRRQLRGFAGRDPVTAKRTQQARSGAGQAIAFLAWLHGRGRTLADCRQAEVDAWHASPCTARRLTHAFLRWAMRSKLMPPVTVPHQTTVNPAPISQWQQRGGPVA